MLATPLSDYVSDYANLNGDIEDADFFHSIVSYVEDGEPRVTGLVTPVTAYESDGVMDSQRRRLTGRGL